MPYKVDDVLEFLANPKTRQEVALKFELSNSESWHLMRWLEKGKYVEVHKRIPIAGKPNRVTIYKAKPE